jgi:hypothetical protein
MGLAWCLVLLADSWLDTPTAFGVPMGVLLLFLMLMKTIQNSNRGGSTATPTETAAERARQETLDRHEEAERQRQEQANRDAEAERQRQERIRRNAEEKRLRQDLERRAEENRQRREIAKRKAKEARRITKEAWREHGTELALWVSFAFGIPFLLGVVILVAVQQDDPAMDSVVLLAGMAGFLFVGCGLLWVRRTTSLKHAVRQKMTLPEERGVGYDEKMNFGEADSFAPTWIVRRKGKMFGPFRNGQLVELAKSGKLKPTDAMANSAEGPWVTAQSLEPLKAVFDQHARRRGESSEQMPDRPPPLRGSPR